VADHEQARYQVSAALASLAAAHARARGAYVAVQAIAANAGAMNVTASLCDVPNVEDIVRDGGLDPLVNDRDREHIAA
jgi:hypothetical protein